MSMDATFDSKYPKNNQKFNELVEDIKNDNVVLFTDLDGTFVSEFIQVRECEAYDSEEKIFCDNPNCEFKNFFLQHKKSALELLGNPLFLKLPKFFISGKKQHNMIAYMAAMQKYWHKDFLNSWYAVGTSEAILTKMKFYCDFFDFYQSNPSRSAFFSQNDLLEKYHLFSDTKNFSADLIDLLMQTLFAYLKIKNGFRVLLNLCFGYKFFAIKNLHDYQMQRSEIAKLMPEIISVSFYLNYNEKLENFSSFKNLINCGLSKLTSDFYSYKRFLNFELANEQIDEYQHRNKLFWNTYSVESEKAQLTDFLILNNYRGISNKKIMYFGNASNDIFLLKNSNYSFTFSDCEEKIKMVSDFVLKRGIINGFVDLFNLIYES